MARDDALLTNLRFNRLITGQLVRDVDDAAMLQQPGQMENHAAWQLGHLVVTLAYAAQLIQADYRTPEGWDAKFGMGSTPSADAADNASKHDLLAEIKRACDALEQRLPGVPAEALAAPTPDEGFRQVMPTVGDVVTFSLASHYGYHLGQLSGWRKALGLPKALPA